MDLRGKSIFVTGGAGDGVGGGICQAVHEAGAQLILNDLRTELVEKVLPKYPGALPLPGDISKSTDVSRMFEELEQQDIKLDGLVNSAGIGLVKPLYEVTEAEYDKLIGVNLRGMWLMVREFTHHILKDARSASIVNISSVHAQRTIHSYPIYASAKSGVEGFTRGIAADLGAKGIRCNAVAPGYVHSEQGFELMRNWTDDPQKWVNTLTQSHQVLPALIDPVDCGWAAVFFLSDKSRAVTGQVLNVDAGLTTLLFPKNFS